MTTIDNWGQCPFHSSILEVNTKWIPNMTSPCSEMQVLLRWKCGWIKLKSCVGKQTLGAFFLDRCQIPLKIIFLEIIKKYRRVGEKRSWGKNDQIAKTFSQKLFKGFIFIIYLWYVYGSIQNFTLFLMVYI